MVCAEELSGVRVVSVVFDMLHTPHWILTQEWSVAVSSGGQGGGGVLTGGGGVPMSPVALRNGNVACLCRLFMPMSHVEFKKRCRMSLSISIPCRMSLSLMSPIDFKKGLCRI